MICGLTASFGFLIHGPTGHYFYGFLDKQLPGTAVKTVSASACLLGGGLSRASDTLAAPDHRPAIEPLKYSPGLFHINGSRC